MDLKSELIKYISKISKIPENEIDLNTQIYNSGMISSLNLLELMTHIEKQYNIYVTPEELIEDNFSNVSTLINFVGSKINS
ncbi:MAG TPA: acyl carrier protein [Ruminiclostridium sp.]|nr:acyl carrier protein [Ruminiclostridium sp.]